MKQSLSKLLLKKSITMAGLLIVVGVVGCAPQDGPATTEVNALPPPVVLEDPEPATVPVMNEPASLGDAATVEMVDDEGNPINELQFVQRAVDYYDRMRPMTDDGVQTPWPPLTDLSQLLKFKVLKALPPAPPGQRFILDPKTLKVSVAAQ